MYKCNPCIHIGINILHHLHCQIVFKVSFRYGRLILPRHSQRVLDDQILREIAGEHEGNLSNGPMALRSPQGKSSSSMATLGTRMTE